MGRQDDLLTGVDQLLGRDLECAPCIPPMLEVLADRIEAVGGPLLGRVHDEVGVKMSSASARSPRP